MKIADKNVNKIEDKKILFTVSGNRSCISKSDMQLLV